MLDITNDVIAYRKSHVSPTAPDGYVCVDPKRVCIFDTPEEADGRFVDDAEEVLQDANTGEGIICSTGGTFESIYKIMTSERERFFELLKKLVLVNQDELMGVPKDCPISYTRYMREQLISVLGLDESGWIIPDPTATPLDALRTYTLQLEAVRSIRLAMLGIGPDSDPENGLPASPHIGFITPGTPPHIMAKLVQLDLRTRHANSNGHPDEYPVLAVTNGPANILRASEIFLSAKGPRKQQNMKRLLLGDVDLQVPATLLHLMSHDVPGVPQPRVSYYMGRDAGRATLDEL